VSTHPTPKDAPTAIARNRQLHVVRHADVLQRGNEQEVAGWFLGSPPPDVAK
jgi:hypothetical protein